MNNIRNIGHVSFNLQNDEEMLAFYKEILGMQEQYALTFADLADNLLKKGLPQERVWIDYIEVAPHQYIELFYELGKRLEERRDQ